MCDSIAEGGQRCAAHTRPRFERAVPGTAAWDDAAADYAATPAGHTELQRLLDVATVSGDITSEAALRSALRVGETRRAAYMETRNRIAVHRAELRAAGQKNDDYWAADMLDCIYSADNIIDRGEETFFEEDNTVEIAAARQHIIDLDTVADRLSPEFREAHPEIPWKRFARARDRLAHHYDNVNRDVVWNVLINEFPKIRAVLKDHLGL
jgi:uncharacterized protein with HEPN domain